jgi:type VI secretion system protein ImpE
MNASEYYRAGQLANATEAALGEVKADPGDVAKRCFLADLLCFAGDLERAERHLDAAAQLDATWAMVVALRRQLLRAEQARRQCFSAGRLPEFIDQPSPELRLRLQAAIALRDKDLDAAGKLLSDAESKRTVMSGICNGRPFDGISDLDELTSSFFEVFTATGKYYWIAADTVERLEFVAPVTAQDLLWRTARMALRKGATALDGLVFFPTLYEGSHTSADDQVKLGRMTDWIGGETAPYRGLGQRVFEVGGLEVPILELGRLEIFLPAQKEG